MLRSRPDAALSNRSAIVAIWVSEGLFITPSFAFGDMTPRHNDFRGEAAPPVLPRVSCGQASAASGRHLNNAASEGSPHQSSTLSIGPETCTKTPWRWPLWPKTTTLRSSPSGPSAPATVTSTSASGTRPSKATPRVFVSEAGPWGSWLSRDLTNKARSGGSSPPP